MPDLTVAICTHNPRSAYLTRVLGALQRQTLGLDRWELLLIDNKSDTPLSEQYDLSWHPAGRHIAEPQAGLSHARNAAMQNASAPILLYVDDDNVLSLSYLEIGLKLGERHPELGCWGPALIEGEFEVPPPKELQKQLHMLALFHYQTDRMASDYSVMPPGAGLFCRLPACQLYRDLLKNDLRRQAFGTKAGSFFRGEDTDLVMSMIQQGWQAGQFVELSILHLIPAVRLTRQFMLGLTRGNGTSSLLVDWVWGGTRPKTTRWAEFVHLLHICRLPRANRDFSLAFWRGERDALRFIKKYNASL